MNHTSRFHLLLARVPLYFAGTLHGIVHHSLVTTSRMTSRQPFYGFGSKRSRDGAKYVYWILNLFTGLFVHFGCRYRGTVLLSNL